MSTQLREALELFSVAAAPLDREAVKGLGGSLAGKLGRKLKTVEEAVGDATPWIGLLMIEAIEEITGVRRARANYKGLEGVSMEAVLYSGEGSLKGFLSDHFFPGLAQIGWQDVLEGEGKDLSIACEKVIQRAIEAGDQLGKDFHYLAEEDYRTPLNRAFVGMCLVQRVREGLIK